MVRDRSQPLTGDHVAIARRLRRIEQRELARRLGMRPPNLSEMERGRRPIPDGFEARLRKALAE